VKLFALSAERKRVVAWLNFQQAYRVIDAALEQRLQEEMSLAWAEYEVLFRLQVAGERPLQMGEIADQLLASPSGVTRIADRLDRDGLITRETPPANRRVVTVRLTPRGRSVLARADRIFLDVLAASFSQHLSDADVGALRRILRKVLEGNGAWMAARCDPGIAGITATQG
jgi:DNA-binding MarR family transcriptional regulator